MKTKRKIAEKAGFHKKGLFVIRTVLGKVGVTWM